MSNQANVDFTFHNVGQGLFYSGRINNFNFVYDCGSETRPHLKKSVNEYIKNKLNNEKIDLLVLSHLHDDHIAGLKFFFDTKISFKTVILPYLSPFERLIVTLNIINLPNWFYDFWADPANYLVERGSTVVFIGNGIGFN